MDKRHIVMGDMVNSSLVVLREGVVVVDTSVDEEMGLKLHAEAIGLGKLLYVINTHEHGDHLAGNGLFGCPIISSAVARERMLAGPKPSALPQLVFSDRMDLFLSEQITVQHFGGHCPGSSVVYFPERRLLFTGDLVFAGRMPYMGQAVFKKWLAALTELESWEVEQVVPGHGNQGGIELLANQRRWLEVFIERVLGWSLKGYSQKQMLEEVLSLHEVPERWHLMVEQAIERIMKEYQ